MPGGAAGVGARGGGRTIEDNYKNIQKQQLRQNPTLNFLFKHFHITAEYDVEARPEKKLGSDLERNSA